MRSVACTQLISRWFKHKYQIRLHVHDSFKHLFVISRQISSEKRDVEAIANSIRSLCELPAPTGLRGALVGDWRLLYVNEAETLHKFGTGLGKLPGTTIMDAWAAFSADGRVTVHEVCRVVGPFPNIRNTLEGTWELRGKTATGFGAGAVAAGATVGSDRGLCLAYDRLTDGRGKTTTADTGFRTREVRCCHSPLIISVLHHVRNLQTHWPLYMQKAAVYLTRLRVQVALEVGFCAADLLVLASPAGPLVLQRDPEMQREMSRLLRTDVAAKPAAPPPSLIEGIAAVATGAKKPWELFRP